MSAALLSITLDKDVLSVLSVSSDCGVVSPNIFEGGATIAWLSVTGDVQFDGASIITVSMKVADDAVPGSYAMGLQVDQTYSMVGQPVSMVIGNGVMEVGSAQMVDDSVAILIHRRS